MRRPTPWGQDLAGSFAGSACAGFSSAFFCMSCAGGAATAGFASLETDSGFMLGVFVIFGESLSKAVGNDLPLQYMWCLRHAFTIAVCN